MKAAFVKVPFQFQIRDLQLRGPMDEEVLVDVRTCGVCGTDLDCVQQGAAEWRPLGHEVAGVIAAAGRSVTTLRVGQWVVLGSGAFDRTPSDEPMGFSERVIVPREAAVCFEGISFTAAALVEPLGVACELVRVAEPALGDDVLVVGTGAIGLMALRLARARGARRVYAAQRSGAHRRGELAREMGADEIIVTDEGKLAEHRYVRGGVDRVLVAAPPRLIPQALAVTNPGGIVAFVGTESGEGATITIDANSFRSRALQLRAAVPPGASALPRCIELIRSGIVNAEQLVSHTFQIEEIPQAFRIMRDDRQNRVKLVMVRD